MSAAALTLDQAIASLANLGHRDPYELVDALDRHHGREWLETQAAIHFYDFALVRARDYLNEVRRREVRALSPNHPQSTAAVKLAGIWIPEEGHVAIGRVTAEQLDRKAAYYERLAAANLLWSEWCHNVAQTIRDKRVATAGELDEIPPLPEGMV